MPVNYFEYDGSQQVTVTDQRGTVRIRKGIST